MIAAETSAPPVLQLYRDMRWWVEHCEICDEDQVFLAGGLGLVACCLGCGDERIAPFTRVNSEVA